MDTQHASPVTRNTPMQLGIFSAFLSQTYMWMTLGLLITGGLGFLISNRILNDYSFAATVAGAIPIIFLLELVVVIAMSWGYRKMNFAVLSGLFIIYSVMNGVFFGIVFTVYSLESILLTFVATMLTFMVMSLYGAFAKQDLTKFGNLALMGLVGLIIASILNLFFASETLYWITTYLGIIIFVVLIAFDTQKLKEIGMQAEQGGEPMHKVAVMGALTLYLDLINLFLYLLRIFGDRR